MADFKTMISRMKDNGKTALFLNTVKGYKADKHNDQLTLLTEKGWGQKVALGKSVAFLLIIDRDEFERLHEESKTEETALQAESTQAG